MIVLAVTWMANEGRESEVADIFGQLQTSSRLESGCLMYIVHRHKTDQRRFFIYEQYSDDAALDAHRLAPYFQQFVVGELPKIAARAEAGLYRPLGEL